MKKPLARSILLVTVAFSTIAVVSYAGQLRQFAAQHVDGEQATTLDPSVGGQPIYQNTVTVPADVQALEVTISATGDLFDSVSGSAVTNSLWLNCQVDGQNCSNSANSALNSVPGWVPVLSLESAAQVTSVPSPAPTPAVGTDNNIHYTWCVRIKPKKGRKSLSHDIQLSMASGDGVHTVHVEQVQVRVDGANFGAANNPNACTSAPAPTPVPVP